MNKRLLIVFILGFSSGLPLALTSSTLQAWFAEQGMPVMMTGMLSLVGIPYVFRMLWGPIADHFSLLRLGRRRSWIFMMQLLLLIGFNLLAWFSPVTAPSLMAGLALMLAFFSATQDMVIDAHRVEYLPVVEHGIGVSLATLGYRVALLIAGGLALVIAQYFGWELTYRIMGFLMIFGIFAVFFSKEPKSEIDSDIKGIRLFVAPLSEFCSRKGIVPLLLFIFLYKLGEAFTATTSGIVMPFLIQGLGFSLATIGYVNKIVGVCAILIGGVLAGFLLMRWTLYRSLFIFGLIQATSNLLFWILAYVGKNTALFATAVIFDNLAVGMGSTALVVLFMRIVDKRFTATQFSILVAFSALPRVLSGPLGASIQFWFGWIGMYQIAFILSLIFVPFLIMVRNLTDTNDIGSKINDSKLMESAVIVQHCQSSPVNYSYK